MGVYFDVFILLLQTSVSAMFVMIERFGIFWWGGLRLKMKPYFL